ncbi:phage tail assembly protein (plasmid) [Ralstonia syzygii subsp. celebesensis]
MSVNEITLQHPYTTAAGQEIRTVTTRRLKVKDLKVIGEQSEGARCCLS